MSNNTIPEFKLEKASHSDLPFKLELFEAKVGYNPKSPHRHNYYEIFFFEKGGSGLHMIDFNELDIKAQQIHILSPGQIHYMKRSKDTHGWVLKFTPEFFLSKLSDKDILERIPFLNNKVTRPVISPSKEEFSSLLQFVSFINEEYQKKSNGYENMIRNYLDLILLKCHRLYDYSTTKTRNTESELCNRFNTLLQENYLTENRVSFYTEKLNVSDSKLNQVTKEEFGKTPSELIAHRLLLEAKRWLLHSNNSVKEIAYMLNFHDNAYFNRWFNKLENCSPGKFRTDNRKKYSM